MANTLMVYLCVGVGGLVFLLAAGSLTFHVAQAVRKWAKLRRGRLKMSDELYRKSFTDPRDKV